MNEQPRRCTLNPKKKDTSNKPQSNLNPQKNSQNKKTNSPRQGRKRPQKNPKQSQKKHAPVKKTVKSPGQNTKENKKHEVEFLSKATLEDNWTIENIERYVLAVRKAFEKIPETEKEEVDLREIWMNSSLPADLIMKIIHENGEKIGIKKNSLFLDGKIVY